MDDSSLVLSPAWQKAIAVEAIKQGKIPLDFLVYILSISHYQEDLPRLWHEFNLDRGTIDSLAHRLQKEGISYKDIWEDYESGKRKIDIPDYETPYERIAVWHALFERWTDRNVVGLPKLPERKLLPCNLDDGVQSIKLADLEDYFTNYLKIPMPTLLFPSIAKSINKKSLNEKPLFDRPIWEEALRMYEAVKMAGFKCTDEELKRAAKKELTENKKSYQFIKQKHLNKTDLFALNSGQEKRDFIGNLLQIITGKVGGKKTIGAQRLYEFGMKNHQNLD